MADVRPKYDSGHIGRIPAQGVFIVGNDGSAVDPSKPQTLGPGEDHSGTITEANVSQVIIPAKSDRRGGIVTNNTGEDMWLNEFGDAEIDGLGSVLLLSGKQAKPNTNRAVSAICATAGGKYQASDW